MTALPRRGRRARAGPRPPPDRRPHPRHAAPATRTSLALRRRVPALPRTVRRRPRRLRQRAQVPPAGRAQLPLPRVRPHRPARRPRHGAADAARHGRRRHPRPPRRRVPPLLHRRPLVPPALREDALRPGATGEQLPRRLADHPRPVLRRHGPRRPGLRPARHDRPRRAVLLAPRTPTAPPTPPSRTARAKARSTSGRPTKSAKPSATTPPRSSTTATASSRAGNVARDPRGEFPGKNVLSVAHSLDETAKHFNKAARRGRKDCWPRRGESSWRRAPAAPGPRGTTSRWSPGTA